MNSSVINDSSSIFRKPGDLIQYNMERAKQKFNKSVQIIKRLQIIKIEEKKKTEDLIKKTQEREKKLLEEMNKRGAEHEKFTMNTNEQRKKILRKKKEITQELDKQMLEYGLKLNERMDKLSIVNQQKLRDMLSSQHEKFKKQIKDYYNQTTNNINKLKI